MSLAEEPEVLWRVLTTLGIRILSRTPKKDVGNSKELGAVSHIILRITS